MINKLIEKSLQILKFTKENVHPLQDDNASFLVIRHEQGASKCLFYKPFYCIILQGVREIIIGGRIVTFGKGQSFIGVNELPMISRITKASSEEPYIALVINIDFNIVRHIYDTLEGSTFKNKEEHLEEINNEQLLDSLFRLMLLSQSKIDYLALRSHIYSEIHYRILQTPNEKKIRDLLKIDNYSGHISKAISIIKDQYNETLVIADIAKSVGMSSSSFHNHFKSITELTPLQYQKDLRLLKARMLIRTKSISVTAVAFEVGYKSSNQFSREYFRKFNINPRADRC